MVPTRRHPHLVGADSSTTSLFTKRSGKYAISDSRSSLFFHSPLPQRAGGLHRQPVTGLACDHHDLTAVMRFVCHEIRQHVPDVEREIPPHVAFGRGNAAICREPQAEESFDAGAAAFQRGYELPRRYTMVIHAWGSGNAVLTSQRFDPPASGVVKVRTDRANSPLRRAGNRDIPECRRQIRHELAGNPVIRAPRSKEVRLDLAWQRPYVTHVPLKELQIVLRQRIRIMQAKSLGRELPTRGALSGPQARDSSGSQRRGEPMTGLLERPAS